MMAPPLDAAAALLDWAVCGRTLAGERESGDAHLVAFFPGGALVAVADGLGHGEEAAEASRRAIGMMRRHVAEPVSDILQHCHEDMRKTRGAVINLASFHAAARTMTWIGIGNVDGILFRAERAGQPGRESLLVRAGVVGYQIPALRAATLPIYPGDTLVFATDGISSKFAERAPPARAPQDIADDIVQRYAKETDDALVLVARYLGEQP